MSSPNFKDSCSLNDWQVMYMMEPVYSFTWKSPFTILAMGIHLPACIPRAYCLAGVAYKLWWQVIVMLSMSLTHFLIICQLVFLRSCGPNCVSVTAMGMPRPNCKNLKKEAHIKCSSYHSWCAQVLMKHTCSFAKLKHHACLLFHVHCNYRILQWVHSEFCSWHNNNLNQI